jgi:CPA2 family monovalent cation:H+ antiporter-2
MNGTEVNLLGDLVIILAVALPIVLLFERLTIPSIVGFIIAGIVIGPHGTGLIADSHQVDRLAEFGVVLLLFVVGLELSFRRLARLRGVVLWAGTVQVLVTALVAGAAAHAAGLPVPESVLLGFLLVHSSTAIIFKILSDRGELDAPHGRITAGILLVQDLSLVPMVLLARLLGTPEAASVSAVLLVLIEAAVALVLVVAAAQLLMPATLRFVVRFQNRELFVGAVVLFCLGTAWVASQFGLSLALGALIAGLVISESEYSNQVVADVLPFRDALTSVFFVSVGMLMRVDSLAVALLPLLGAAAVLLVLKTGIVFAAVFPVYRSPRVALVVAASLGALGELSFVLAGVGREVGILPAAHHESFIAVAVLTMLAAPFLMNAGPRLALLFSRTAADKGAPDEAPTAPRDHVLVVGYGLNGRHLAHVLRATSLPYLILELSQERVEQAQRAADPILYGDATSAAVLRKAGAAAASAIVIAISDPVATRRIVALARHCAPATTIVVRTRYVAEIEELQRLGATEVIPEEFETSVEIFARVLRHLRIPRNVISSHVDLIREEAYGMLRGFRLPRQTLDQLDHILAATTTESFLVTATSPAVGQTLGELRLRQTAGVTIIAVVRRDRPLATPGPDFRIEAGDILVIVGSHAELDAAFSLLEGRPRQDTPG